MPQKTRNQAPRIALPHRRLATLALWGLTALLAPNGTAQPSPNGSAAARQPILHEPLPAAASTSRNDQLEMSRPDAGKPGDAALPEAILTSLGRIAKPPPAKDGDGTPTYGKHDPPRVGVDRRTGADLELHYQVVFDPAIAPFKRDFAYDQVAPDLTLRMSGAGQRPLPGSAEPRADHELFWGHVKLSLQAGQPVVLPSVAPTSQILSWQALPPTPLQFFRDDAGNFSVSAPTDAQVDLRFLMDAPSAYFAAPLGTDDSGRRGAQTPTQPQLDPALQQRAAAMWPQLGLSPALDRGAAVAKLVEWFRSFRPGALEQASGDPARDLVLSQRGVCRHRALGLVLMAHSLGIPSHYVMNEAHAFVEIWVPLASGGSGWQRVDLGGGSDSLELHAAQNKRLHQPLFRDPFPRPTAYNEQVGQVKIDGAPVDQAFGGAGQVKGAEGLKGGGPQDPAGSGAGSGGMSPGNSSGSAGSNGADETAARREWLRQRAAGLAPRPIPPRSAPAAAQRPSDPPRLATSLQLDPLAAMAWVGEPIRIAGTLTAGNGAPRLPIEIWLIDPARPTQARLLGTAPTDADGHFAAELALPPDILPQSYDIVARFAGDPRRAPCDSGP